MPRLGTQSDVARELQISRQAVSRLIKNEQRTMFPDCNEVGLWDLDEVRKWYLEDFNPGKGPRRGIRKLTQTE